MAARRVTTDDCVFRSPLALAVSAVSSCHHLSEFCYRHLRDCVCVSGKMCVLHKERVFEWLCDSVLAVMGFHVFV